MFDLMMSSVSFLLIGINIYGGLYLNVCMYVYLYMFMRIQMRERRESCSHVGGDTNNNLISITEKQRIRCIRSTLIN